jgi:hypothetical protein
VGFDDASRLFNVAGSKSREQFPHENHALAASFGEALFHEKHLSLGECLSDFGTKAL